jgi:pimeloyl-ACP methyl ester carboxylesterase
MACTLVVVLVVLLWVGCGGEVTKSGTAAKGAEQGVGAGGLVDVGGRRLYVECMGSGSPTVVLEAGLGGDSAVWSKVLPEIGRTTRVYAYDRAGLGASDAVSGVHDASDDVRDLERLLAHGRIAPPYVLVGHSYGGFIARLFARAPRSRSPVSCSSMLPGTTRRGASWRSGPDPRRLRCGATGPSRCSSAWT